MNRVYSILSFYPVSVEVCMKPTSICDQGVAGFLWICVSRCLMVIDSGRTWQIDINYSASRLCFQPLSAFSLWEGP